MDRIDSRVNPKVKRAIQIGKNPSSEAFLVEGYHAVQMAEEAGCLDEVFSASETLPRCSLQHFCPKDIVDKISTSKNPEPIVGIAHYSSHTDLRFNELTLVLDRIQDPGNLGTLLRTALSFGFRTVCFLPGTCSPFNPKVISATQGAIFQLSLRFFDSETTLVENLKAENCFVVGTCLQDASPFETLQLPKRKLALVLGNEGRGVSKTLLASCNARVKITMETMESLNVGVAGGILMHGLKFRAKVSLEGLSSFL